MIARRLAFIFCLSLALALVCSAVRRLESES